MPPPAAVAVGDDGPARCMGVVITHTGALPTTICRAVSGFCGLRVLSTLVAVSPLRIGPDVRRAGGAYASARYFLVGGDVGCSDICSALLRAIFLLTGPPMKIFFIAITLAHRLGG